MRVLLMTQNILLGDALESILSQAINLLVHRILFANADGLLQAANDYQPDVIILEEGIICQNSLFLPSQWEDNGRLCIILVNPEINQIHIHNKFRVSLTRAADFIALIENYSRQWQNAAATAASTASYNANAP
jgi:DNA-binding NarL/FixJ family response regulator